MNEPVAWMCRSGLEYQQVKEDFSYKEKEGWIPLYTHPVKELTLTDEDILEEWTCKYSDCYQDTLIEFAKAILRKAQENG